MPEDSPNPTIESSPERSTTPRPGVKVRKGNFATRVFGYDVFLSFALGPPPRGTVSYASDLARRLAECDYTVFFSEEEAPPGDRLDTTLQRALLCSHVLVVVANRDVLREPRWVRKEVDEFRRHHPDRPVATVNVDGALQDPALAVVAHEWLADRDTIWVDESAEAVTAGIASHHVVERLATAPARVRSNAKWRQIVGLVIITLAGLGIGLGLATRAASNNAEEARAQQRNAEERARIALSRQLTYQGTILLPWNQVQGEDLSDPFRYGSLFEGMAIVAQAVRVGSTKESYDAAQRAAAWMRSSMPSLHFLPDAGGPVSNVGFTEEGRRLLRATGGTQIDQWLLDPSGADVHLSKTIMVNFDRITFSQDGRLAALLSAHKKVELLDANSGAVVSVRHSASGEVIAFTFTPDATWLLIAELAEPAEPERENSPLAWEQLRLTAWNVVTGKSTTTSVIQPDLALERLYDTVVAASPDNRTLVMSSPWGSEVWVIDWRTGSLLQKPELDCAHVTSVDVSPDGRFIAAGCAGLVGSSGHPNGTLAIWPISGETIPATVDFDDTGAPLALDFFPDSTTLGATYDGTFVAFDVRALLSEQKTYPTLKDLWLAQRYKHDELPAQVRFVVPGIGAEHLIISPTGDIAVFDAHHVLLVKPWGPLDRSDVESPEELSDLAPKGASTLALTSDGRRSAFIDESDPRTIGIWSVLDNRLLRRIQLPSNLYDQVDTLYAFSGDGTKFVVLQKDGTAWFSKVDSVESGATPTRLVTPRPQPSALALNRDASAFVLGYEDGTILIWERMPGKPVHVFAKESGAIGYLAADSSGLLLATVSQTDEAQAIRFWDLTTGRRISQKTSVGSVFSVAFSPERNLAALAEFKGGIVLLDVQTGTQVGETTRREVSVSTHLAFGPDESSLIIDYGGKAERLDPVMAICTVLNNELGGRRWTDLVGEGFDYQPACVQRPSYLEWLSQANLKSTAPLVTNASPITEAHETTPAPTGTASEPERSALGDAEDATNWNRRWFLQFRETSSKAACLRANEPDLRNASVLRCDDPYHRGAFLVRLGPAEDRAELDPVRRTYLNKGVFSVMLRYEDCLIRPRRVECR